MHLQPPAPSTHRPAPSIPVSPAAAVWHITSGTLTLSITHSRLHTAHLFLLRQRVGIYGLIAVAGTCLGLAQVLCLMYGCSILQSMSEVDWRGDAASSPTYSPSSPQYSRK